MEIVGRFSRRETIDLTGATSNQLQSLERADLIVPERIGKSLRPTVLYTWEQLLEIRAIKNLRKEVSLQAIRKIIEFLDEYGFESNLRDKQLIAIDEDVFWVRQDWSDFVDHVPTDLKVTNKRRKNVGQYTLLVIPTLADIVDDVWKAAENSPIVDIESFKKRAKNQPV